MGISRISNFELVGQLTNISLNSYFTYVYRILISILCLIFLLPCFDLFRFKIVANNPEGPYANRHNSSSSN